MKTRNIFARVLTHNEYVFLDFVYYGENESYKKKHCIF